MLNVHHSYDPFSRVIFCGDGSRQEDVADLSRTIRSTVPVPDPATTTGYTNGVASAPDGSMYVADAYSCRVFQVRDGVSTVIAGRGGYCYSEGDGGPASSAAFAQPYGLAVGTDNSIYISEFAGNRVRRIRPDGIIETVAGFTWEEPPPGVDRHAGDGGPAVEARLYHPERIAIGPDGSLFVTDYDRIRHIRRVDTGNIITTFIGGGLFPFVEGGTEKRINLGHVGGVSTGSDGTVYLSSFREGILRVSPEGRVFRVGTQAPISLPGDLAYNDRDGSLTVVGVNSRNLVNILVGASGKYFVVAGGGNCPQLPWSINVSIRGSDNPYWSPICENRIPSAVDVGANPQSFVIGGMATQPLTVQPSLPGFDGRDLVIPSSDGGELFHFDRNGRHLRTVDRLTQAELYKFGYDGKGRLELVTNADNATTTILHDDSDGSATIIAPGGQRTTLRFDANGNLSYIANPAGDNVVPQHRGNGLLDLLVDERGYSHNFQYDSLGRLELDEDPIGGFQRLTRTDTGPNGENLVTRETTLGRRTVYSTSSSSGGAVELGEISPSGAATEFSRGADGISIDRSPDGTVTESMVFPDSILGMGAPYFGRSTEWTPGGLSRHTEHVRIVSKDPQTGNPQMVTDNTTVNERSFLSTRDLATGLVLTTSAAYRTSTSIVDNVGRILTVAADPALLATRFTYYPSGSPWQGKLWKRGTDNSLWTYEYDEKKRLFRVHDPQDNVVEYDYDEADRVNSIKLPSGRTYGFKYDRGGNRSLIRMPLGQEHLLGFSPVNLDNGYTPPENLSYEHTYSFDREWKVTRLPSGKTVSAEYDNTDGRLGTVTYPEAEVRYIFGDNTSRVYELVRTGTDNSVQRIAFDYDGPLTTRVSFEGSSTGEYRYAFDNNFWTTGVALDNTWTTLGYDNDGLLDRFGPFLLGRGGPAGAQDNVSDMAPPETCGTDSLGQPLPCIAGYLIQTYGYDNVGRMNRRTMTVAGNTVYDLQLDRDSVGRIWRKVESVPGESPHTFNYTYDVDGQLYQVWKDGSLIEEYGYDNNANRNRVKSVQRGLDLHPDTDVSYDSQDRMDHQAGVTYTYDDDGFLMARGSDSFTYSSKGELVTATTGGHTVEYRYDGMARRVARVEGADVTQYLYGNPGNPFQVTASRAPDNTLTTYFYDVGGSLLAFERSGERFYVGTDHLGSPLVVTDNTGTIIRRMEYDGLGVKTYDNSATFDLPVGFAGGIPEEVTGLVRFGWRDYEPGTGRWTTKDPIFHRGGLNLYVYVGNNPINGKDPDGRAAFYYHFADGFRYAWNSGRGFFGSIAMGGATMMPDFNSLKNNPLYHATNNGEQTPQEAMSATLKWAEGQYNSGSDEGIANALHAIRDVLSHEGAYFPDDPNVMDWASHIFNYDLVAGGEFGDIMQTLRGFNKCRK